MESKHHKNGFWWLIYPHCWEIPYSESDRRSTQEERSNTQTEVKHQQFEPKIQEIFGAPTAGKAHNETHGTPWYLL